MLLTTAALGAALLMFTGCTSTGEPDPVGNLASIDPSEADRSLVIGELVIDEPGAAVFDAPDGVTIGRLDAGVQADVVRIDAGWAQIQIATDHRDDPAFGWVPTTSSTTLHLDGLGTADADAETDTK